MVVKSAAFLLAALLLVPRAFASVATPDTPSSVVGEYFPQYNGLVVRKIEVNGLERSRPTIVRWILGAREGAPFDALAWQIGVERLYKTESLYDIHSEFREVVDAYGRGLEIRVTVSDKWTLFPYLDFQGGGGSLSLSAGIFDSNLLGTFTNFAVGGGYLDHEYSYDVELSQNWFLQTNYSAGIALSKNVLPVDVQNHDGFLAQSFTWSRTQQEIFLGKTPRDDLYFETRLSFFRDGVKALNPRNDTTVYRGLTQWRISPAVKIGKVSHADYLEQGHELGLAVAANNPGSAAHEYYAGQIGWKQVFYLPETKNFAYYATFGHMSVAPLAYQLRLGGFDSVRGFSTYRAIARDTLRANFEYRATFWAYDWRIFDVGRMVLQGCLFSDLARSWNTAEFNSSTGAFTGRDVRGLYSAGAGLRAIFLHFSNAVLRLDWARTISPNEGFNVAFGIGQFF